MAQSPRAALECALRATWQRRGPAARALWPLGRLYGVLARRQARRATARADRLPVPVIVIGNVVAGGAGKTPTTLAVVEHLRAGGWRPGILSRGYGRSSDAILEVRSGVDPARVGDEPLLLHQRSGVPVAVGARRAAAGHLLLAAHPDLDILVCDDGLQHRALARDVEICVFDARGVGNGWLLPAGPLREPWPRPVDLVLITEEPAPVLPIPPGAARFAARRVLDRCGHRADGAVRALAEVTRAPVTALAAIARPEAFFAMLESVGVRPVRTIALADHADPARALAGIPAGHTVICTEKDAAKVWRTRPDAVALPLRLDIPAAFFIALDVRIGLAPARGASSGHPPTHATHA